MARCLKRIASGLAPHIPTDEGLRQSAPPRSYARELGPIQRAGRDAHALNFSSPPRGLPHNTRSEPQCPRTGSQRHGQHRLPLQCQRPGMDRETEDRSIQMRREGVKHAASCAFTGRSPTVIQKPWRGEPVTIRTLMAIRQDDRQAGAQHHSTRYLYNDARDRLRPAGSRWTIGAPPACSHSPTFTPAAEAWRRIAQLVLGPRRENSAPATSRGT